METDLLAPPFAQPNRAGNTSHPHQRASLRRTGNAKNTQRATTPRHKRTRPLLAALPRERLHRPAHSATVPTRGYNTPTQQAAPWLPSTGPVLQPSQSPSRTWLSTSCTKCTDATGLDSAQPASAEARHTHRQPAAAAESTRGHTSWFHPFACQWFHVLLNSLFKVLCNFPSQYLFAIGLAVIFSLRWSLPPALGCTLKQPDSRIRRPAPVAPRLYGPSTHSGSPCQGNLKHAATDDAPTHQRRIS